MDRTFQNEQEFRAFAEEFAQTLQPGDVVALSGPLGAGKTTFVKAAVARRCGDDVARSPTFTFWHRYDGTPPIDHLDLYRIDDPREVRELGLEDAFAGTSIVMVEWWQNAAELLPPARYEIEIEGTAELPRRVRVRRNGNTA